MGYLLGIDIGTSSVKSLLMDEEGNVAAIAQKEYDMVKPEQSWADQKETCGRIVRFSPELLEQMAGITVGDPSSLKEQLRGTKPGLEKRSRRSSGRRSRVRGL